MHRLAVAAAFGIAFVFCFATEFQERDDSSLDIFSDLGWLDLEDTNLSLDDGNIFEDPDSDPLLASACDAGSDQMLPSKLRARDNGVCFNKDPTPPTSSWFNIPNIFKKLTQPSKQTEPWGTVPDKGGNFEKCFPPYKFNLCCNGQVWGVESDFSVTSILLWVKIEDCYAGMPLKMFPPMHHLIVGC